MRLKEGEPASKVYFRTRNLWHSVPEEQARDLRQLDFEDWRNLRTVWCQGPGRAVPSEKVARTIKETTKRDLDLDEVKALPPGSWINNRGMIYPKGFKLCYTKFVINNLRRRLGW